MCKIPVTVIVPVKNEEVNLPHCLDLLRDFHRVIVVDSSSTDSTPEIVRKFGFELINFSWDGKFPKKRNWVLRNIAIDTDWVFFLDADEYITEEFIEELRECINDESIAGYWIRYTVYFMGRKLRFGDPMYKLSLFRKQAGEYEYIAEDCWSDLDMEVHEHPIIEGKTGYMESQIQHNDFKGLERYISRHEAYADWEAKRYKSLSKYASGVTTLTYRQRLKYGLIKAGVAGAAYFIGCYFLKLGFLDGKYGFMYAWYKAKYFNQVQKKIRTLGK